MWNSVSDDPEGAVELLELAEAEARAAGRLEEASGFADGRKNLREGHALGSVARDPHHGILGVAFWEAISGMGRRVSTMILARDHQTAPGWRDFLSSLLDRPDPAGPVLLMNGPMPGFSEDAARTFLDLRGFQTYHRYDLLFPPGRPLPDEPARPLDGGRLRTLGPDDLEPLTELSSVSYAHTVDRYIFATTNDDVEDARRLLLALFGGQFGAFVPGASFGLEIGGKLRGATLVTSRPTHRLLADVEVHPSVRGQGHARRLVRATLEAAGTDAARPLGLAVTGENRVAFRLYQDLGFVIQDGPFPFWADSGALGIDPVVSPTAERAPGPS